VDLDHSYEREHSTVEPGRYVMLVVSDTGRGMDPETLSHIFEPFFTTKGLGEGTGLGLSTVYGIVKQAGGHILPYSEAGQGTAFKIYLPAVPDVGGEPQQMNPPSTNEIRGTETILLLEDEPALRKLVHTILEQQGYSVLEAGTPEEALRLCEEHAGSIQLLLTDVVMPKMSGRQVAERAVRCVPELRVIYMSGYSGDAIVHHGVLDSGVAYLQKPFSSESLLYKVREVLNG
jgi:CheY-like chemotaxis protein